MMLFVQYMPIFVPNLTTYDPNMTVFFKIITVFVPNLIVFVPNITVFPKVSFSLISLLTAVGVTATKMIKCMKQINAAFSFVGRSLTTTTGRGSQLTAPLFSVRSELGSIAPGWKNLAWP